MKNLALLICLLFPALFYSQVQKNYSPKVNLAIETYAFLKGQDAALQKIELQFPKLRPNVAEAQNNSKVLFKRAKQNIERFLGDEIKDSDFSNVQKHLDSLLSEQLKNPIEKEKYALDFLKIVRDTPAFITDTLLLKGIISFAYYDAPQQEVIDGHITTFKIKNDSKAKQTVLKIPVPKSWLAEETLMPETMQQFTSYCGKGMEKFLIVVYDLPEEKKDLVVNKKSVLEMIPPDTRLIRSDSLSINKKPAMMIEVEETVNADKTLKIRMLQFMFVHKQKLYCLQGSIGPVTISENLTPQLTLYEPLFRFMVSNTKLED